MSQSKGNKAKGRQSSRNAGFYAAQFFVTTANKLRREARRAALSAKRNTPEYIARADARLDAKNVIRANRRKKLLAERIPVTTALLAAATEVAATVAPQEASA